MHFVIAGVITISLLLWVVLASNTRPVLPMLLSKVGVTIAFLAVVGASVGYTAGSRTEAGRPRFDTAANYVLPPPAERRQYVPFPVPVPAAIPMQVAASTAVPPRRPPVQLAAAPRAPQPASRRAPR